MFIGLAPRVNEQVGDQAAQQEERQRPRPVEVPIGRGDRVEIVTGVEGEKDMGGHAWKEAKEIHTPDLDGADEKSRRAFRHARYLDVMERDRLGL